MSKAKLYKNLKQLFLLSSVGVIMGLLIVHLVDRANLLRVNTEFIEAISIEWLFLVLFLAGLNWMLEIIKWHQLINTIQNQSWWESAKAVLLGVALGIITPNRIGEYGGRVIFLEPEKKKKGLSLTLLSSFYQLLITLIFGLFSLILLLSFFQLKLPFSLTLSSSSIGLCFAILLLVVGLFLLFRQRLLTRLHKWLSSIRQTMMKAAVYRRETLFLSFLRYLVFTFQFGILLIWLGAGVSFLECILMVSLVFFLNTISPGGFLLNLGWRATTAVFLFSLINANIEAVVLSTFLIWIINLFIPGLFGAIWLKDVKSSSFSWK